MTAGRRSPPACAACILEFFSEIFCDIVLFEKWTHLSDRIPCAPL
jgi:hypothetical protein